jgi:hypothetical protein
MMQLKKGWARGMESVYERRGNFVIFKQLGVKIAMDLVSTEEYYSWLDEMITNIGSLIPGSEIAEKPQARVSPPLNTAIYYDTADYQILPTGALLRTSCNKITHAFCAFKASVDSNHVRRDHRYVFDGQEKVVIQQRPDSMEAIAIVKRLLARDDIEHPGTHLNEIYGIDPKSVQPSIRLDDYRFTFFAWLDGRDALRCSLDRFDVSNLRLPDLTREYKKLAEVELSIYPRIDPGVAEDSRVRMLIEVLSDSLCNRFAVSVTHHIKYQRAAQALGIASSP